MNPVLEAFRGAAALMVMLHHYAYYADAGALGAWPHALHNGVDLFFVISGYLFAPALLGLQREPVAAFAVRRALRLYPLYLLSLAVAVAKDWGQREGLATATGLHLLFLQALPGFGLREVGYFSEVYWTLPVEVAFYLLVALAIATAAGSLRQRWAALGLVAGLGFLASHGWPAAAGDEAWVVRQAQLPALLLQFWFGASLRLALPRLRASAAVRRACALSGALIVVALVPLYAWAAQGAATARPFGLYNLASGLGYALLLGAALASPVSPGPGARRLALTLGALSYATYLFHEWVLKALQKLAPQWLPAWQVAAAIVATLALAWLLHRWVEDPLHRWGRRLAKRFSG